ncbi:hypothetical protein V3C99_009981 [Haemonchus contortus]
MQTSTTANISHRHLPERTKSEKLQDCEDLIRKRAFPLESGGVSTLKQTAHDHIDSNEGRRELPQEAAVDVILTCAGMTDYKWAEYERDKIRQEPSQEDVDVILTVINYYLEEISKKIAVK